MPVVTGIGHEVDFTIADFVADVRAPTLPEVHLPKMPHLGGSGENAIEKAAAALKGAKQLDLTGQGLYDPVLGTTHLGILQSPQTQAAVVEFLQPR